MSMREDAEMRYAQIEGERDALAAHVESPTIQDAIDALGHGQYWQEQEELEAWKATAPSTSLVRLKVEWQAEALEYAADNIAPVFRRELKARADELRRQAEDAS